MRRQAYTLVEVIVAMLLATTVIMLLWNFFRADQRRYSMDQNRFTALQGALLLDEHLATDMGSLAILLPEESSEDFSERKPVLLEDGGRKVTFLTFGDAATTGAPKAGRVSYFLDGATSRIVRQTGASGSDPGKTFRGFYAEDVQFSLVPLVPDAKALDAMALQPTMNRDVRMLALRYRLTLLSEAVRDMPVARQRDSERITLVGAVPVAFRREFVHHPVWSFSGAEVIEVE